MTEKKRKVGRPKGSFKPTDQKLVKVGLRVRPDQRDKLDELGGSKWLRRAIDNTKL